MFLYAFTPNVAQPWLDGSAPVPRWFESDEDSSLRGSDLDAAYDGFMHALVWDLRGRSDNAKKAAAGSTYEFDLELLELEEDSKMAKGGGSLPRLFTWMISRVGSGVLVLLALFSFDVVSPRDKPCPLDSPPIPPPGSFRRLSTC